MAFGSLSVKGRALRLLSQREHSRAELERKLARRVADDEAGPAGPQIAAALDELAAHGLLSEARVAESVLNAQGERYGRRRLQQVLQAKGLAPELVASTLRQAAASELERARAVWRRRYGAPAADAAGRVRQVRFLTGRGFELDVVRAVLREAAEASHASAADSGEHAPPTDAGAGTDRTTASVADADADADAGDDADADAGQAPARRLRSWRSRPIG